ncbi:hypothetical protein AB6A40_008201 [Gnathostoma spinigerum]|uniref:Nuclear pore complex protein NUP96 C-terminal domain-containing protein n=1 Tax=Gnathostoma spinigerum TaxID=75299 RepID=A0ABD6EQR5_9BILA
MVGRRESVGNWLKNMIRKEPMPSLPPGPKKIFYCLTCGNISEAIVEAVNSNYPSLAIALSTFLDVPRRMYKDQLNVWTEQEAKRYVNEDLLRVYMLLAGEVQTLVNGRIVYLNEGLSWMQALGMFLWYRIPLKGSVKDSITAFEIDIERRKALDTFGHTVFFELIKLAFDQSHSMESVIEPCGFTQDPFDYHMSWHLWSVLSSYGYRHMTEKSEHHLHIPYAEQLARMGLIHFAIFVVLHITDNYCRTSAVEEILSRYALKTGEPSYRTMRECLHIPERLIARARYFRAKEEGDYHAMCKFAISGEMYDVAHRIFMDSVAPEAVTSDDYKTLGEFSAILGSVADQIPEWGPLGRTYVDFYHLHTGIREIVDDAQVTELLELAYSLEHRLSSMNTRTPCQRLSVSIISRIVFEVVNGFTSKQAIDIPLKLDDGLTVSSRTCQNDVVMSKPVLS